MTLTEMLDGWLEEHQKEYVKRQTYVRYRSVVNNYVRGTVLGEREIGQITRKDMQDFVNNLRRFVSRRTGKPLAPGTVNNAFTVLQSAFGYAEDYGLVDENPCVRIHRMPKAPDAGSEKCFTVKEQQLFEKYVDGLNDPSCYGYILCLYTGLRIGEFCALTWKDVDLTAGTISVNKSVYNSVDDAGRWKMMTDTPKTRTSFREIPLPDHVVRALRKIRKKSKSEYLCASAAGERITPWAFRYRFDAILREAGVRHITFHGLRHTFATRAIEHGMDVRTLSEILGHSNPSVTLNVYTHSMDDHKRNMMRMMQRV